MRQCINKGVIHTVTKARHCRCKLFSGKKIRVNRNPFFFDIPMTKTLKYNQMLIVLKLQTTSSMERKA